ncbi:NFX1-type zinc finger-containing protein 1 isoform X2 [Panulirus ornatus]
MDKSYGFSQRRPQRGYYNIQDRYRRDDRRDDRSHLHGESLRPSQSIQGSSLHHHNLLEDSVSRGGMGRFRGRGRGRRAGRNHNYGNRRGAVSLDSLSEHITDERKLRYSGKNQHRRDREFPIGYGELERLLTLPADAVILELLSKKSGYQQLLELDKLPDEKFNCLLEVLSYSTSAQSNKENMHELFIRTCEPKFLDKLCNYTITIKRLYPGKAENVFTHVFVFLEAYASALTSLAIDRLPNLLDSCISSMTLLQREGFIPERLLKQYEALQEMLTKAAKQWVQKQLDSDRRKQRNYMYELEPPDDFKELSVLPTPMDLKSFERPFLRKNIVQGKYEDDEHYLDVQFRLLREDFIRPLRNGIKDFISNNNFKSRNVRIYRNVWILGFELKNNKLIYNVQLDVPKKFKFESLKCMLYGNLLCFSNDSFKSMLLASVAGRDSESLKKGIIQVLFETDVMSYDLSKNFVMIESKAYFMPYKHVLKALQSISGETVPMSPYVIHIQPNVEPPKYLHEGEQYDLRVIKGRRMMKNTEAYSKFIPLHRTIQEPRQDQWVHLKDVFVLRDLIIWPSEDDLGLDNSQRRALRSAITRQLAIIQGPPGTGKTFLGLKIAQVLLHNSKVWKNEDNPTPILVVCYTNHALDQFLEGMATFTSNIVRVGSRTKSEIISRFQINLLSQFLGENRMIPSAIHVRNTELQFEISDLENEIRTLKNTLDMCNNAQGIISLDILVSENIVPPHLQVQFEVTGNHKELTGWLLCNIQSENNGEYVESFHPVQPIPSVKPSMSQDMSELKDGETDEHDMWEDAGETDKNDIWKDAEVLHDIEESNRLLEDDERDEIWINHLDYETTFDSLEYEMNLAMTAFERDRNNAEAYFMHNICASQREALRIGLSLQESPNEVYALEELRNFNIWSLNFPKRWYMYKYWLKKLKDKTIKRLVVAESNYNKKTGALEEVRNQKYLYIMRSASIVGMTTTGAAQYNSLMKDLAPAIVIIEEAAEILESHVITSLSSSCQHLIMIGDHQQLRPSATVYELATKYGLETSLFERMIKNGLPYETLEYQHRMKPCISSLLVPSVYPHLKNHPSVDSYQSIKGITKDVFFISHQIHEKEGTGDTTSHENIYEAELLMGLCRHLILQGYSSDDITILTPYTGQFFLLCKIRQMHRACNGVEIHVVDNFQGEENNIILLSLVRSNVEGKVGFLSTSNRICVALSRAKHGLYITGNMELLTASSELWEKIKQDLTNMDSIGNSLTLKCQNHPDQLVSVSSGKDFLNKSPEGGCLKNCGKLLPNCNHTCPKVCHTSDKDHKNYRCQVPCPKNLCDLGHPCPKMCWEKCAPCETLVEKLLPCGHSHQIFCHISPEHYDCPTQVVKEITVCQHKVSMSCHQDPNSFQCPMDCDSRLDCGHMCRKKCHCTDDPDHLDYDCLQRCTRINVGCSQNHPCQKMCHEYCGECTVKVTKNLPCGHEVKDVYCSSSLESIKCHEKCKKTLPCGHSCKKICHQSCEPCPVKVAKVVPECNHTAWIACGIPATTDVCDGSCQKKLPCGHPCSARCKEVCTVKCTHPVTITTKCPKGHSIMVPCHLSDKVNGEDAWEYCKERCNQLLNCKHECVGNCGSCFQGRLHVSCRKPCKKLLVCGHICQHPCTANCPPCQEQCQWHCEHSQCRKNCGVPCVVCQEKCEWKCAHQKCKEKCGEQCSRKPCIQACPKKLTCGHSCVGFCGDPCPPLCRICDVEELTEFLLSRLEGDDDARFVFLEDCGHTIEVHGLEGWLHQERAEIHMKTCPRCRKPIYNNRRYQSLILETYRAVKIVKNRYFTLMPKVKRKEIEVILQDLEIGGYFMLQTRELQKKLGINLANNSHKQNFISKNQLILIQFQAQVLKKATDIVKPLFERNLQFQYHLSVNQYENRKLTKNAKRLQARVEGIVELVMGKSFTISSQMVDEVSCELQRLMILPAYWAVQEEYNSYGNIGLQKITAQLEKLMDPTVKFDEEVDTKVCALLKECERFVGSLKITHSKKIKIMQGVGLAQGNWYNCPKGHIYCVTEFQGAVKNDNCPFCLSVV